MATTALRKAQALPPSLHGRELAEKRKGHPALGHYPGAGVRPSLDSWCVEGQHWALMKQPAPIEGQASVPSTCREEDRVMAALARSLLYRRSSLAAEASLEPHLSKLTPGPPPTARLPTSASGTGSLSCAYGRSSSNPELYPAPASSTPCAQW